MKKVLTPVRPTAVRPGLRGCEPPRVAHAVPGANWALCLRRPATKAERAFCYTRRTQGRVGCAASRAAEPAAQPAMANSTSPRPLDSAAGEAIASARLVLDIEAQAIAALKQHIGADFERALDIVLNCRGRVVVCGIGKSGHIARKIASTLASTGTPAFFVHAAEASHGDLGMITREDVFIALSNSGESAELLVIVPLIKRRGAKLIALTGNPASSLGGQADVCLYAGAAKEACPLNLAPTASTTAALALGDALAVALMQARGFSDRDFASSHPGGKLGTKLTLVRDAMRTGEAVPHVQHTASVYEAVGEMSRGRMGVTAVLDDSGAVTGIFTDGDLRRTLGRLTDFHGTRIVEVMTRAPRTIQPDRLAAEAVQIMEQYKVNQLLVVDAGQRLIGALNMHDLFRAKVI
ncbi:MAG: KpsF/GutQ family sugar-phosphate isomerase [Burkholderiales bacterium]|nr:KpsF/GutQ family sugar-phosphate isomerase [Burkholderiales bacterium]